MTQLCIIDDQGFIRSCFNSDEFANLTGILAPEQDPPAGYVWKRVDEEWVPYEDNRGKMFSNPNKPEDVFVVSALDETPPTGWTPYGEAQRQQDALSHTWKMVRAQRNARLQSSDWTQVPDSPFAAQKKQQWVAYRQQLRDVTDQPDPFNIVWPTAPN
jgi:hypothetical protein